MSNHLDGFPVDIYRSTGRDCTNGGVSAKGWRLTVVGVLDSTDPALVNNRVKPNRPT